MTAVAARLAAIVQLQNLGPPIRYFGPEPTAGIPRRTCAHAARRIKGTNPLAGAARLATTRCRWSNSGWKPRGIEPEGARAYFCSFAPLSCRDGRRDAAAPWGTRGEDQQNRRSSSRFRISF